MRLLLPLFAVAFLLAGCGQTVSETMIENAIEREGGENVDVDMNGDGTMNIETEDGELSTSGKLPSDWPTDVPVMDGAKVVYAMSMSPESGQAGKAVMFTIATQAGGVSSHYEDALPKEGWKIVNTANMGGTMMIGAEKDGRTLSLIVTGGDGGETTVNLAIEDAE